LINILNIYSNVNHHYAQKYWTEFSVLLYLCV